MHYVYLLESVHSRTQRYVGQTRDLKARIIDHNAGRSIHTRRHKPWNLVCYLGFANERRAIAFERYLKSGSDRTFVRRHFLEHQSASAASHS
ncbi:MAG TPA: GIY-YIG nuclease family protein [Opitutaceae bacterium]|nr:GIY-YIG nuclease family protein [Opitutaceae bacterium]